MPTDEEIAYRPRIAVKFKDHVDVAYEPWTTRNVANPLFAHHAELPPLEFEPTLWPMTKEAIGALVKRARRNDHSYEPPDFLRFFETEVPDGIDAEALARTLRTFPNVERADVESPPGELPGANPGNDPLSPQQEYLNAAPQGINARHAWAQEGGNGAGVSLADIERGWLLAHEDLKAQPIEVFSGVSVARHIPHGTAILGILAATDNDVGCIGIVHGLQKIWCVSEWRTASDFSSKKALRDAICVLCAGDVLLLEAQASYYGRYRNAPLEIDADIHDLVRLATASGITVVAAAGNGRLDLDGVEVPGRGNVFNRPEYDSLAIMVGGGTAGTRERWPGTNFGKRIDCFAWANNVMSPVTDNRGGPDRYAYGGGTSTAAAIVAGAAVAVQGVARKKFQKWYQPKDLRALLRDASNTLSNVPASDCIGVMPDLQRIIDGLMPECPPTGDLSQCREAETIRWCAEHRHAPDASRYTEPALNK